MDLDKEITALATKARNSDDSSDALRFSQAALNLTNATRCVYETKRIKGELGDVQ